MNDLPGISGFQGSVVRHVDGDQRLNTSRRFVLKALATLPALAAGVAARAAPEPRAVTLTAAVTRQQIVPGGYPETEVWSFNGAVPGPPIAAGGMMAMMRVV
jgi:hypothetical protein